MASSFDPNSLLTALATKRKVFHSEADFQHAFAWHVHERFPDTQVRLEAVTRVKERALHLDLLFRMPSEVIAVELKYKSRKLSIDDAGEVFNLQNHGAQDHGRYDAVKDIWRLERFQEAKVCDRGFLIFLTNDASYWKGGRSTSSHFQFEIAEGAKLTGTRKWGPTASAGTKKGRELEIDLTGSYQCSWQHYSHLEVVTGGEFRYLAVEIPKATEELL